MRKEKHYLLKRTSIILAGALLLSSLFGCDKQDKNLQSDAANQSTNAEETEEIQQLFDGEEASIPKHIDKEISNGGSKTLKINADVQAIGYDDAKTYGLEKIMVDDAYLTEIAQKLFDQGKFESVLPYDCWDKTDLEEERKRFDEMLDGVDPEYGMDYRIEGPLESRLVNAEVAEKPTPVAEGGILYATDASAYGIGIQIRFANLRGEIDGKEYELMYYAFWGENDRVSNEKLELVPVFPVNDVGLVIDSKTELGEHETISELEQKANDLIEGLGYGDFYLNKSSDRTIVVNEGEKKYYDGGMFRFVRKFPELLNSGVETEYVENIDMESKTYTLTQQEYISVELNENGELVRMDLNLPYRLKKPLSEKIEMLSFNGAMDAINDYFKQASDDDDIWTRWADDEVNSICLAYIPLEYENQYVYMPAWILCQNGDIPNAADYDTIAMLAVNAVDGNIYLFETIYGMGFPVQ